LLSKREGYKEKHFYGNEKGTTKNIITMETRKVQRKTLLWKRGEHKKEYGNEEGTKKNIIMETRTVQRKIMPWEQEG
jgi:hypothetical protein